MATKAYVLIETAVGKSREVAESLKGIPGMQAVDAVTGPYDIIAVLEAFGPQRCRRDCDEQHPHHRRDSSHRHMPLGHLLRRRDAVAELLA